MRCSPEQSAAIESRNENLLIAAAAGSGKTSVLVERIIRRIISPEEMLNIDRLLVVTFTNAAASEMRSRIQEALAETLSFSQFTDEALHRHIQKQLTLSNAASISTIHSFCQSVLRQYFYHIGLDQNFRVAGKTEIELIKSDILEELIENSYAQTNPDWLLLADNYGGENDDSRLIELILSLYEFSRSHPWPDKWLENLTKSFDIPAEADFNQTPWPGLLKDKILLELEISSLELDALIEEAAQDGNPQSYADTFSKDLDLIDDLTGCCSLNFEELRKAFNSLKFPRLAAAPKDIDETIKKSFQDRRNNIKARVKAITETYFARGSAELIADLKLAAPEIFALVRLTKKFSELFTAAKRAKNLVDFSDLEHLTLEVLRAENPSAQDNHLPETAAADELKQKYLEIMIDEYQDINMVQEEILNLLTSKDRPNLFMVGDVKQSIYRFRLAEPELFMHKHATYHKAGDEPNELGRRIDLSRNFRSRKELIGAVNFIFGQLMRKRTAEIEYGPDEELNFGASYYAEAKDKILGGPVELCLIDASEQNGKSNEDSEENQESGQDKSSYFEVSDLGADVDNKTYVKDDSDDLEVELSGFEQESLLIARKITDLISGEYLTYDKQTKSYRPLTFRDIVVLLRSDQGKAAILLEVLRQQGIPSYARMDTGYFKETEVSFVLSLLKIIDNPRQDIDLAALLRSPLVGLDIKTIAQIRLNKPDGNLWEALVQAATSSETSPTETIAPESIAKITLFLKRHANWRNMARRKDVAKLIHTIYEETNIYDYVGGMPGGDLRRANLDALYNRAKEFETTDYRGLFRFLRFIERLKESGADLAVAKVLGEGENVVRVMSIHKSKGLEFPVVIVADLGKKFNLKDAYSMVLCHKELGVGPYVNLAKERLRYPTPARWGISHKIELESKAEELRVLYVALTRAREKLILVGSSKKLAQKCHNWLSLLKNSSAPRPHRAQIFKAASYLDLVCLALISHPDAEALRNYPLENNLNFSSQCSAKSLFKITVYPKNDFKRQIPPPKDTGEIWTAIQKGKPLKGGRTDWVGEILNWNYPYSRAVGKPAKLTVTEIKRRLEFGQEYALPSEYLEESFRPPVKPLPRPRFLQEKSSLTKIEYGIVIHTLLQHIALDGDLSAAGIAAQAAALVKKEILLPNQVESFNYKKIAAFFSSALGKRLLKSNKVWREVPFSLLLNAETFYPELKDSGEQVFVQGVIDCVFAEGEGVVLIDYKTDAVSSKEELANKYAAQLSMYCLAIESIFRFKVKGQYLYSFVLSEAIELSGWG